MRRKKGAKTVSQRMRAGVRAGRGKEGSAGVKQAAVASVHAERPEGRVGECEKREALRSVRESPREGSVSAACSNWMCPRGAAPGRLGAREVM